MPSRNTNFARKKGYSNIKVMKSGGSKDYGVKTGACLDTSTLRIQKGKSPWKGDEKAKKAFESRNSK